MTSHWGNEHLKRCEYCKIENRLSAKLYAFGRTGTKEQGYKQQGITWHNKWIEVRKRKLLKP